ncbi:MAG TPA: DUF481 domain-containing protein [Flavisolibacter sp.]
MRKIAGTALVLFCCLTAFCQSPVDKVRVFLDCTQGWLCDFDFVRSELKMVSFVRDRFDADVHVQVNTQNSSSGGVQAQVIFLGLRNFQGASDTLTYFNDPTTTSDDQRKKMVQYLKLGLVRFIAKTPMADHLGITLSDAAIEIAATAPRQKDPWNYWVFQFGSSGSFNGSQNNRSSNLYGYVNATQETETWKISFNLSLDRNRTIFKQDNEEIRFDQKNYSGGVSVARAINSHWSYGISSSYQNSLFRNIRTGFTLRPRLEYSIFPYEKFNNQRIVVQYFVGPVYNRYYDTTIFFKTEEFQVQQSLYMITSFNKPWGNVNLGVFWSNYFDDFEKNNLSFNGAVSWRITKGLNFGIYGYYGLIQDQITLRKGAVTRDQLLTNNRELLSSFEYNLGLGFSYRFGSVSNSIVNPRFKGLSYSVNF